MLNALFDTRLPGNESLEVDIRSKLGLEWTGAGPEGLWPLTGGGAGLPVLIAWDLDNCRIPDQVDVCQLVRYLLYAFVVLPGRDQGCLKLVISCSHEAAARAGEANLAVLQRIAEVHATPTDFARAGDLILQQRIEEFVAVEHRRGGGTVVLLGGSLPALCTAKRAEDAGMGLELVCYAKVRAPELLQVKASWQCDWLEFISTWSGVAHLTFPFPVNMVALRRLQDMNLADIHAYLAHVLSSLTLLEAPQMAPVPGRNDCLLLMLACERDALLVLSSLNNNDRLMMRVVSHTPPLQPSTPPRGLRSSISYPPAAGRYSAGNLANDPQFAPPSLLRSETLPVAAASVQYPSVAMWPAASPQVWPQNLRQQPPQRSIPLPGLHVLDTSRCGLDLKPSHLAIDTAECCMSLGRCSAPADNAPATMPASSQGPNSTLIGMDSGPGTPPGSEAGPLAMRDSGQQSSGDLSSQPSSGAFSEDSIVSSPSDDHRVNMPEQFGSKMAATVNSGAHGQPAAPGLPADARAASSTPHAAPRPLAPAQQPQHRIYGSGMTIPPSRVALHVKGFQPGMSDAAVKRCVLAAAQQTGCADVVEGAEMVVRLVMKEGVHKGCPYAFVNVRSNTEAELAAKRMDGFVAGGVRLIATVRKYLDEDGSDRSVQGPPQHPMAVAPGPPGRPAPGPGTGRVSPYMFPHPNPNITRPLPPHRGPPPPVPAPQAPPAPVIAVKAASAASAAAAAQQQAKAPVVRGVALYVKGFPQNWSEEQVRNCIILAFSCQLPRSPVGSVQPTAADIAVKHHSDGEFKGYPYAFVNYASMAQAEHAKQVLDNFQFGYNRLTVNVRTYDFPPAAPSDAPQPPPAPPPLTPCAAPPPQAPPAPLPRLPSASLPPSKPQQGFAPPSNEPPPPRPAPTRSAPPEHLKPHDASRRELYVKPSDDCLQSLDQAGLGSALDAALFTMSHALVNKRLKLRACDGRPCAVLRFVDENAAADALGRLSMASLGGIRLEVAYLRHKPR